MALICVILFLIITASHASTCTLSPSCNNGNQCLSDFKSCVSNCDHNICSIEFETGDYNWLFHSNSAQGVLISNINNLHIYGSTYSQVKIIIHGLNGVFSISNCNNFTMSNIVIDMYRLPFTYGIVIKTNISSQQFTLQFNETQYQIEPNPYLNDGENYKWLYNVGAILGYDPINKHPQHPDIYTQSGPNQMVKSAIINTSNPSKSTMIIETTGIHSISNGQYLIIRHQVYSYNFMSVYESNNIQLTNITVYTIPGMGFYASKCINIHLDRVMFIKYNNRPLSLCADATHFALNKGIIHINNSIFEGQGDDGLNVHNFFFQINKKISSNSLYLQSRINGSSIVNMVSIGDIYEFRNRSSLQPYFTAKMINISRNNIATFDKDICSEMSLYDVISSISSLPNRVYIENSIYHSNRARGTLIKVSNVTISNVTYVNVTGPAMLIRAEAAYWLESTVSNNILIENNHINHCNYDIAQENGTITIEAIIPKFDSNGKPTTQEEVLTFGQVHSNFTIINNVFDQIMDVNTNHNAISMRAVKDGYVNNNKFIEPNIEYVVLQKWNCGGIQEFNNDQCYLVDGSSQKCIYK
eukprot:453467_1